jgi:hypothetical protein
MQQWWRGCLSPGCSSLSMDEPDSAFAWASVFDWDEPNKACALLPGADGNFSLPPSEDSHHFACSHHLAADDDKNEKPKFACDGTQRVSSTTTSGGFYYCIQTRTLNRKRSVGSRNAAQASDQADWTQKGPGWSAPAHRADADATPVPEPCCPVESPYRFVLPANDMMLVGIHTRRLTGHTNVLLCYNAMFLSDKWRDDPTPLVVSSYLRQIVLPPGYCCAWSHAAREQLELEPTTSDDGEAELGGRRGQTCSIVSTTTPVRSIPHSGFAACIKRVQRAHGHALAPAFP